MNAGGTSSVSQTRLGVTKNAWPAACMAWARIVRIAGLPRRPPTAVAVSTDGDKCT